jgi:tryptophan 2,3-dioxygenase
MAVSTSSRNSTGLVPTAAYTVSRATPAASATAALAAGLAERSLADAHADAAARLGVTDLQSWADFYVDPGPRTDFYLVCEALVDYDERWIRWRQEHVALVQRTLGDHARGTGGMAIAYLQRTTRYRFFPVLWALRDELVVRGGGQLVGRPEHETT